MASIRKIAAVGLLGLACAGAWAQISKSGQGYLFRYNYAKGKTYRFAMESVATNPGMNLNVGLKFKITVLSANPKTAKLRYVVESMTQNGKPMGRSQTFEIEMDRLGNVVGNTGAVQQLGNVAYPKEPVAVGKSWTRSVNSNAMGLNLNLKGTYTLTGFKSIKGREYAVIAVTMKNTGDFTVDGSGTMLVDRTDGILYDYKMTMTIGMKTSQQTVSVKNSVTIKRQ